MDKIKDFIKNQKAVIITILVLIGLLFIVRAAIGQDLSGDLRLRHESTDTENQNQVRARIRFNANINDTLNAGVGLTTGNMSLSGTANKNIAVDLAYLGWTPNDDTTVTVGKINNNIYRPGNNELLWSDTLHPEGIGVQFDGGLGVAQLFVNGSYFVLSEDPTGEDLNLLGGQAGITLGTYEHLTIGAGHYYITIFDYSFYEYFVELEGKFLGLPGTLYGEYVNNNNAESWIAGGAISKGIFELSYNYRDVDYDVIDYIFSDPDYANLVGFDGGAGHEFGIGVDLMDNVETIVTYFANDGFDDGRVQADLVVNF